MRKADERIRKIRRLVMPLLRKNGVVRAGLFGSYARGEETKASDVDILVRFRGRKSLLNLAALEMEIEKKLGKRVDVLTYGSVNPLIRGRVLKEEVRLL